MANSAPMIGLDKCYVAKLVSDSADGTPSWSTPVAVPGSVKIAVNANGNLITDWADNRQYFVTNSRGNTQVTAEFVDLSPSLLADMLGQTRANGITLEKPLDQSNYYAMGFRIWIGDNDNIGSKVYRYVWLLKGKFAIPSTDAETKKEQISPQHITLSAEFIALNSSDNVIGTNGRSDYDLPAATIAAWFNAPVYTTDVDTGAVTCAITADDTANTTVFTFTKSGGGTFSIVEDSVTVGEDVLLVKSGASVSGSFVWTDNDGTATTVVGTFTPSVAYGAATVLASITSGVKDSNGVGVTPVTTSLTYTV